MSLAWGKSKLAWKTKLNRKSKYIIRAWRITERKTCVEEINHFVEENYRIHIKEAGTPLPDAKERWPEWYERSFRMSNDFIYRKTGYRAEGSIKRNGRSRAEHMQYMSECRKAASYEHVGRPKGTGKQELIWEWRRNHPEGSKAECIRDTGLSKPTVYKWWDLPATAKNPPFVGFATRSSLQSGRMQHQRMYQYYRLLARRAS